ncbi:MAG: TIGR04255 family protein [Planctomycetota bacterium]|jgi:uncharacterized protein (TIGR04255 family)
MTAKLRLDFGNLPLVEAAVRISFNNAIGLTYAIVNSIEGELKPRFPNLTEPKQIEVAPGAGVSPAEFGPGYLPGAVFTGHKSGVSLSVHPQVIVARWVKHPALTKQEYPRYPALRDSLWTAVEAFRQACGDEFPGIAVVNMSYVNFIPSSDPASIVKTYFSDEAQLQAMRNARQVRKLEAAWTEDDDLDVRFALEQATAKLPDRVSQGYRLTTAAGLRLAPSTDAKSGLAKIHDRLQIFFLKLISKQARDEWKLEEASE